ncbi:hypothetical protein VpaChn25_A0931 [Vibrio parahaemolyticus]|nr:hypothetical protein VpaChn25_A0931 [Vibrio parahaemolyticus]
MFNINWMGFQTQPECGFRRRQQDDTNVLGVSGLFERKKKASTKLALSYEVFKKEVVRLLHVHARV